jgi:hypothetical protein
MWWRSSARWIWFSATSIGKYHDDGRYFHAQERIWRQSEMRAGRLFFLLAALRSASLVQKSSRKSAIVGGARGYVSKLCYKPAQFRHLLHSSFQMSRLPAP